MNVIQCVVWFMLRKALVYKDNREHILEINLRVPYFHKYGVFVSRRDALSLLNAP